MTFVCFFFFNDTATTEIYTLSLHDALPISPPPTSRAPPPAAPGRGCPAPRPRRCPPANGAASPRPRPRGDRKSTRLNSSHANISYAVFCLKKKQQPNSQRVIRPRPHNRVQH